MTERFYKIISCIITAAMLLYANQINMLVQRAGAETQSQNVTINEVAWAGSQDNSNDEWIELFNPTAQEIDLAGWKIMDDETATYEIKTGVIKSKGFFLIEDSEVAVNSIKADAVINISLANSGDSLVLKSASGEQMDAVNLSGGAWFAGSNTSKTTMERINPAQSGDKKENWKSNTSSSGATASGGSLIQGTPGVENSAQTPNENPVFMVLSVSNQLPEKGDQIVITAEVFDAMELFAYGIGLNYESDVLKHKSTKKGPFLSQNEQVPTSFQSGLQNAGDDTLLVAEARTMETEKKGVSGDGKVFEVTFEVIGEEGDEADIKFTPESFMASPKSDLKTTLQPIEITVTVDENSQTKPVKNLKIQEAPQRYALTLTWEAPTQENDEYLVTRKTSEGKFEQLGTTTTTSFTDSKNLIPLLSYTYQVIAVTDDQESQPAEILGKETRGITGDNDRSDRVDGRDLQNLAKHFGETDESSNFVDLVDTTYDGRIDGNDLIDIGVNWAKTFSTN